MIDLNWLIFFYLFTGIFCGIKWGKTNSSFDDGIIWWCSIIFAPIVLLYRIIKHVIIAEWD